MLEKSIRPPEVQYRPDIDGLRGIAVLSVVAYHVGFAWAQGGFTGVDVFFVISGFLITQLLLREAHAKGSISIANFYARRVRRLLPALATVMIVTLLAGAFLLPNFGEKPALGASARAALLFVANHHFQKSTGGYFDGPSDLLPLLHLWSLSVEEQFYVVWPLLFILCFKLSPPANRILHLRILIAALLSSSFLLSVWWVRKEPSAAFFFLPSRAWELALGAMLATLPSTRVQRPPMRPAFAIFGGMVGMALIVSAVLFFNAATLFPGETAAAPVLGTALLIYAGTRDPANTISKLLASKPLVAIGLLSYNWYLWHWPMLSIVRNRRVTDANLWVDSTIALIALGLAALTVRYIENPIRHAKAVSLGNRRVLVAGAGTLVMLIVMARVLVAVAYKGPQSRYPEVQNRERPPNWDACGITQANWDGNIFRTGCTHLPSGADPATSALVVLWGDSHADAWAPGVRALASQEATEFREISVAGCPPVLNIERGCTKYSTEALRSLAELRTRYPKRRLGVVLTGRWPAHLGTFPLPLRDRGPRYPLFYSDRRGSSVQTNLEALEAGLRGTLEALHKLDARVLILLDGPEFRIAPVRCADLYGMSACFEPIADVNAYRQPAVEVIRRVAAGFSRTSVLDPLPFFCQADSCPAFHEGNPVDWDDSHVSVSAAKAFAPAMLPDFRWLIQKD